MNVCETTSVTARVLIVDDENLIARSIGELLEFHSYEVGIVQNGTEAIDFLDANPDTDIVLLDINLGYHFSGIDLIPVIREKNKYVQIIMFTSEEKLEIGLECLRRGAYDFMTKPFDNRTFFAKVPGALERKKTAQLGDLYLGIIAHDLKNPLQGLMSSLEMLRMSFPTELAKSQKKYLLQADAASHQILLMVNNIVSVSRFENKSFSTRREQFVLQQEVAESLSLFTTDIKIPGHTELSISFEFDSDLVVTSDKDLFRRVLVNIVSNAMHFSQERSAVEVGFYRDDDGMLHVTVRSAGSFIDERSRESIFSKFSSVQVKSSSATFKNYGLGLTFSKLAVKAMGGKIWIDCDPRIPSTTFHYTLKTT